MQMMPNDNEDSIWVKIRNKSKGKTEDLYIGTYYVSPPNNKRLRKKCKDFFTDINEEITSFKKKRYCFHTRGLKRKDRG